MECISSGMLIQIRALLCKFSTFCRLGPSLANNNFMTSHKHLIPSSLGLSVAHNLDESAADASAYLQLESSSQTNETLARRKAEVSRKQNYGKLMNNTRLPPCISACRVMSVRDCKREPLGGSDQGRV